MSISEKNPKLAKLAGQFIKFYAFSMLVTLLQYLLLTFLPGLFYAHTDWCSRSGKWAQAVCASCSSVYNPASASVQMGFCSSSRFSSSLSASDR